MKKVILSIAALAFIFGTTLTSCTKDDTTAPVVTVIGGDKTVSLNGTYEDQGATAKDDEDGDLTSSITLDKGGFDVNVKGVYTFTYSVTDAAGNVGTATRKVTVVNDKENMAGRYNIVGTYDGATDTYYTTGDVTASSTINNRIVLVDFAAFDGADVYANISGTTITIPSQTITCGSPAITLTFVGAGTVNSSTTFAVSGTLVDTSAPTVSVAWAYAFSKQ